LVAEDDNKIAQFLKTGLEQAGYAVDQVGDGESALQFVDSDVFDLLILDLMLPKKDGIEVLESIRGRGHALPVLVLSARRTVDERVLGLTKGADDYLTKPFSFAELLIRIEVILRRAKPAPTSSTTLAVGDIELNLLTRTATRQGNHIELQAKEFALLEYFMRHPNRPLTKTLILEHIWNYDFDPQTNVVDVLVCRLRNKIDKEFGPKRLITLRGLGYVLRSP